MGTFVELKPEFTINEETARKVKRFLLGGNEEGFFHKRRNSDSSSSSEQRICPDTETRENVTDWDDEENFGPNEEDESPWAWLSQCDVGTFSDCDFVLVSFNVRFVLLERVPSGEDCRVISMKELPDNRSVITSNCVFGLCRSRHSDQLDTPIVAIGSSDGYLYFYTEKGTLLFYEKFGNEPINIITLDQVRGHQVFLVALSRVFFLVNTASLNSVLLQSKSFIARGEKTADDVSNLLELKCERLAPEVSSDIVHIEFLGHNQPSSIDQYNAASARSFFTYVDRPALPIYSMFAVTCASSFVSFVWYDRCTGDKIWDEAIKYGKSLLPTFGIRKFFGLPSPSDRKTPLNQHEESVPARGTLLDNRVADRVALSPDARLLAVVDCAARVCLVDVESRQIAHVWKGYRDASVAWLSTKEGKRIALFLAIFAPRRKLLEVWCVQSCIRVSAHRVDGQGFLLSGGGSYLLCGVLPTHIPYSAFFVTSTGEFKRIDAPFHLSLVSAATNDQHDQLLLKKLQPDVALDVDSFADVFSSLKVSNFRRTAFIAALKQLKSIEHAHNFLARIRTIESSQSLGSLPTDIEKALSLYTRIVQTVEGSEKDISEIMKPLDETAKKIVFVHLESRTFQATPVDENHTDEMNVGEWMSFVDWQNAKTELWNKEVNEETNLRFGRLLFGQMFDDSIHFDADAFTDSVLEKLPFSKIDIAKLLCLVITEHNTSIPKVTFARLVELFASLEMIENGILTKIEGFAVESTNMSRSILILSACHCAFEHQKALSKKEVKEASEEVNDKVKEEEEVKEESFDAERDEWDALNAEAENLDSVLICMHATHLAQIVAPNSLKRQSFIDVVVRLDSYIRERIASWAVRTDITPSHLSTIFPRDAAEVLGEEKVVEIDLPEDDEDILRRLGAALPFTVDHDKVCGDISWEFVCCWFRDKNAKFEYLKKCVEFIRAIVDDRLRHGVSRLIWDKFISYHFKMIATIVENTGRAPKERESKKELGFAENRVVAFLAFCQDLLEVLRDSVRNMPPIKQSPTDNVLQMAMCGVASKVPYDKRGRDESLSQIAVRRPLVNFHLVLHHLHLIVVLRLQLTVGLRLHPIRTVFCSVGSRAFFLEMDSHPLIPLDRVDNSVMERRQNFLTKVAEQGSTDDRRHAKNLAAEWNINVNAIALIQALTALRQGNDSVAIREMTVVIIDDHVAASLARILAARMLRLIEQEKTTLTIAHTQYLTNMGSDEVARVECDSASTWRDAVISMGRMAVSYSFSSHAMVPFVKLNDIARQYWAIQWMS